MRIRKAGWKPKAAVAIIGLFAAWLPLASLLSSYLVVERPLEKADAIVVMSGAADYVERNLKAAELYHKGVAPIILLTNDGQMGGWDNERKRNPYFVERAQWLLTKNGVPPDAIRIVPGEAIDTHSEVGLIDEFAAHEAMNAVLIVTSGYHSRRVSVLIDKFLSRTQRPTTYGITSANSSGTMPPSAWWWTSVKGSKALFGEYTGIFSSSG